jgi:predicted ribonuclease toxin of YeeF-YezG toxin-antitoxin module
MTVKVLKIVATTVLTNASAAYGTAVGTGVTQVIKRAIFSNTSGSPATLTVNIVPTAGSAVVGNQVINARTIQNGETYISPELAGMELITGDQIYANASANTAINMTISGIQVS